MVTRKGEAGQPTDHGLSDDDDDDEEAGDHHQMITLMMVMVQRWQPIRRVCVEGQTDKWRPDVKIRRLLWKWVDKEWTIRGDLKSEGW